MVRQLGLSIEDRENGTTPKVRRRRLPTATLLVAVLALLGVAIMLYPSAAAWYSQLQQSRLIVSVDELVQNEGPSALEAELARAHDYNDALLGGAIIASGSNVPTGNGTISEPFDYASLLRASDDGVMGRLRIAAINLDLPIYHGTSDETLSRGVGHLEGTSLPVGGASAHSVLTAHRGLPSAELFTHLDRLGVDDEFTIEIFGEVLVYRVIETHVVEPDQTEELVPRQGRDLVTLITCTPLGVNSHRILVTGERVTPTPVEDLEIAGAAPDIPGFPWWILGLGGAVALLGAFVWRASSGETPDE